LDEVVSSGKGLVMRRLLSVCLLALSCAVWPAVAAAQTSTIAGVVRDASGGVLPGVTVEVASPALIEKVRTVITDSEGRYSVVSLRPGTFKVTFTLPGFGMVVREGIELTSDFTANVNAEMKVGTLEETITVTGESPIVDTQAITQRHVMTRDVLDVLPTGRNIQAVGIMIPGTTLAVGGGGALSRDVGGSGQMQQSPLQFRGSADTVQTIEGLRLNNLCAQGAYSGVYWNDASFEEISYITGADSTEMGQGGIRVNMVPRDGGNQFRGQIFANYAGEGWGANNCGSSSPTAFCSRSNLAGSTTFNPGNTLTNVEEIVKIWDVNPSIGGPIKRDVAWFYYTFRNWGTHKTKVDAYFDKNPSEFIYEADLDRKGIDDGHIRSNAVRLSFAAGAKDKFSVYHDDQAKFRNHWGIAALVPPDASAIQVTPTSFVNVTKWTRGHWPGRQGLGSRRYSRVEALQRRRRVEQSQRQRVAQPRGSLLGIAHHHGRRVVCDRLAQLPLRDAVHQRRLASDRAVDGRCPADQLQRRTAAVGDLASAHGRAQRHQDGPRRLPAGSLDHPQPPDAQSRPSLRPLHRRDARERGAAEPVHLLRDCQRHQVRRVFGWQGGRRLLRRSAELEGRVAAHRCGVGRVRQRPHGGQGQSRALYGWPAGGRRASVQPGRVAHAHGCAALD
jgi:hypothetical protein